MFPDQVASLSLSYFSCVCVCVCVRALASTLLCILNVADFLLVCVCVYVCAGAHLLDEAVVCVPRPCCYSLADLLPA
jgi:hypothetical protein